MMAPVARAKRARTGLAGPPPALTAGSSLLQQDRDWTSLPSGPAGLIAERVLSSDVADYVCFRAVCAGWRACCVDPRAQGVGDRRFHPRRWIMLPRAYSSRDRRRCFLNVSSGERVRARIPDLRSSDLLGSTAEGLLVLCRKQGAQAVQLFNPLTGQLTHLPGALIPMRMSEACRSGSFRLHSAAIADDSTVALLYNFSAPRALAVAKPLRCLGASRALAVAKPGDERWERFSLGHYTYGNVMASVLPYAGRLYCVTHNKILVVEAAAAEQRWPRLEPVALGRYELELEARSPTPGRWWMYPAYDDEGNLILVHRRTRAGGHSSEKYTTYQAKLDTGSVVRMRGLGGQALFLCRGRSLAVPAARISSSVIGADTVYVCNDSDEKRPEVVAFDLLGGSVAQPNFDDNAIADALRSYVCS